MSLAPTVYTVHADRIDTAFNIRHAEAPELKETEHGIPYIPVDACLSESCSWIPAQLQRFKPNTSIEEWGERESHPYRIRFTTPISVDKTIDGIQVASINGFAFPRGIGDEIFSTAGEPPLEDLEEQADLDALLLELKVNYHQNNGDVREFVDELAGSE